MAPHPFRPLLLPLLVAAACAAGHAAGQTPPPGATDTPVPAAAARSPDASSPVQALETITVTGTRRREPVRDVPVQLNTLPAEQLEQSGARTLTDYMSTQPGVDIQTAGGAGRGSIAIRGVDTGGATIATVGVYVDEVPFGSSTAYAIGSSTALDMGLLDLNRVEVLRGPQGTIYGASTMGGLIKYVTNDPDFTRVGGSAGAAFSNTAHGGWNNTLNAVLNAPIDDHSGVRLAAFHDHFGGFVDAVGPASGTDINSGNTIGGRISAAWEPASNLRFKVSGTMQEIRRDSNDLVDYDAATGQPANGYLTKKLAIREPYSVKTGVVGLDVDWDLGWARLNSVTSGQNTDVNTRVDATFVYGPLLAGSGLVLDQIPLDNHVTVRRQGQELRLTSPVGVVEWIAGYFYDHERGTNDQLLTSRFNPTTPGPALATIALPSEYTENAVFGDITWNPSRELSLTGGVRSAKNKQSFAQISDGPLAGGSTNIQGTSSETTQTYLATARYKLTPTSSIYARAASGYRPGGPNAVIHDPATGEPLAPPTFKSDSLWSYEGGYKGELLNRTLSVEASLFEIQWKDIQQIAAVNGFGVIVNAGKAKIDGAELAMHYRPVRQLTLDLSYSHLDGKLTEDATGLGKSGAPLPNSPKDSFGAGANYNFEGGGHQFQLGGDLRYVGSRNAGFEGSGTLPNYKLPDYTTVNLHATADFRAAQVTLFVRNVADKHGQLGAGTNFIPLGGYAQVTPLEPRTIGLSVSGTF